MGKEVPPPHGPGPAHWSGSGHSSLGTVFPPQREAMVGKTISTEIRESKGHMDGPVFEAGTKGAHQSGFLVSPLPLVQSFCEWVLNAEPIKT